MADRKEILQERYEDALFALLMEDMAAIDGKALLEENERLQNDPAAQVPEELDKRCEKVIRRHFAKETAHSVGRITVKSLKRVAAAVGIAAILLICACAVSETVRANTLNLITEIFSDRTTFRIKPGQVSEISKIEVGWLPEGFVLEEQGQNNVSMWWHYQRSDADFILIEYTLSDGTVFNIDTEDALIEYIDIHGLKAMLVEKDGDYILIWATYDKDGFISMVGSGVSKNDVIRVAEDLKY